MPYGITSSCPVCHQEDSFLIGNWPDHLGVFVCPACEALVNIPLGTSRCPGCGAHVRAADCYDYSFAIPYLGGQFIREPEPGPTCPKCSGGSLSFTNTSHLNMGMVVSNREGARATWGKDYIEKAIFMNSMMPVIEEFQLDPMRMLDYFNLDVPSGPLITRRISFPILLDIRTHVGSQIRLGGEDFGCQLSPEEFSRRWTLGT